VGRTKRRLGRGRTENGFERARAAAAVAVARDRHGSSANGRRRVVVVVHYRQPERHPTTGIVAERLQVPIHGDEEEISADQGGTLLQQR